MTVTLAEEDYLKAIYKISERQGVPVSTNAIAEEIRTRPASVAAGAELGRGQVQAERRMKAKSNTSRPMERP